MESILTLHGLSIMHCRCAWIPAAYSSRKYLIAFASLAIWKEAYGSLLVSSLSACPFYRFYAEFGVFLPPYLPIIPIPVDRQLAGVPWVEPTDFQKRPPYQEVVSNSTKSYPYIPRPISYRGDLPYAYRSYLPLPCTRRPLYITAKRVPRR